ncbi:RNA polymerase sigma factor [Eremococcus coleocola]|uniref:RNA polymerase sigma factor SigS n=1 Tax=Eremococcus coleocola ACS-139-V-Col8 TaxID=908337 RepID=E4KNN7_9LACT|nr:sigma-70 family RNA polymerase sigma factor [Eremococcus coleocola]EFR31458.1 Sigma-70 region 2 [Eremococcus coleocola ACS-139-V-Col8]
MVKATRAFSIDELVLQLKQNFCEDLFNRLMVRLSGLVYKYAYFCQRYQIEYEDYRQEAMITLYACVNNFCPKKQAYFVAYFETALKNRMFNLNRRRVTKKRGQGKVEIPFDQQASNQDAEGLSVAETLSCSYAYAPDRVLALKEIVADFIESLSPLERKYFIFYRQGFSNQEISQKLGINLKSAQNIYDRCRIKLLNGYIRI